MSSVKEKLEKFWSTKKKLVKKQSASMQGKLIIDVKWTDQLDHQERHKIGFIPGWKGKINNWSSTNYSNDCSEH